MESARDDGPDDHDHDDHDHDHRAPIAGPDTTLGGYFALHKRPPAFEGIDGQPYTVSVEAEKVPNLRAPWVGYLVFPRWAETGVGIVGHVETPNLWEGKGREEIDEQAGAITLMEVKQLLDQAIRRRIEEDDRGS